jgi:hypothetical protein
MNEMHVCDLSAIEYVVVGYLARCKAINDTVREKRDPYLNFAPTLFAGKNYTYEDLKAKYDKHDEEVEAIRQQCKAPILGGGFGLGGGELYIDHFGDERRGGMWGYALNMCGVDMPKALAHQAVRVYRKLNWEVPIFWTDMEMAFKHVLQKGGKITVGDVTWNKREKHWQAVEENTTGSRITFSRVTSKALGHIVRMRLPSGRYLHYLNARITEKDSVVREYSDEKTGKSVKCISAICSECKTRISIYDAKKDGTANPVFFDLENGLSFMMECRKCDLETEWVPKEEELTYDGIEHSATTDSEGKVSKGAHKWGPVKTYGGKLCLAGNTLVVTDSGLKRLDEITLDNQVWDGVQWVRHSGLIDNGIKETQTWMGLTATPDHLILAGKEWRELGKTTSRSGLCSLLTGLASGIRLWYSQSREKGVLACDVIVDKYLTLTQEHSAEIMLMLALLVHAKKSEKSEQNNLDITSFSMRSYAKCGSENSQESYLVATIPNAPHIAITADGELNFTNLGDEAVVFGCNTPSLFLAGMTQLLNLIELTMTEIMNPAISVLSLEWRIQTIAELLSLLLGLEKNCLMKSFADNMFQNGVKTLSDIISRGVELLNGVSKDTNKQRVYDLANCGPYHRFTVMTMAGPLLVHNCENGVQAFARDILEHGLLLYEELGGRIFGVWHDEGGAQVKIEFGQLSLADLRQCMITPPKWAPNIILDAAGYVGTYYKKG